MTGPKLTTSKLTTLKRRAEFLRIRGGARCATPWFVVEAKPRAPQAEPERSVEPTKTGGTAETLARFGFTVTKQLGNAVTRNKIRRRLKEAVREIAPGSAKAGLDYVIIARQPALERPFELLRQDLAAAVARVNRGGGANRPQHKRSESANNPLRNAGKDGASKGRSVHDRTGAKDQT